MGAADQVHPEGDAWVVSVHASEEAESVLGGGIVLDERRILTCAHVVEPNTGGGKSSEAGTWQARETWVGFPKAEDGGSDQRVQVERVAFPAPGARVRDLAVLHLAEPVPAGATVAPLRCPRSGDLVGKRWWVFGFPGGDPVGDSADGRVGAALGHGWIRLDTGSRYPVLPGFSGSGLWSPDYRAVVGIVCQARSDRGDGRAITLYQADWWLPEEEIRVLAERWSTADADEIALSAWRRGSRVLGVGVDSERGYWFQGRRTALQAIRDWLATGRLRPGENPEPSPDDEEEPPPPGRPMYLRSAPLSPREQREEQEADRREAQELKAYRERRARKRLGRVLVVTGAPGTGKSAVLGQIVTTASAGAARRLPPSDTEVRATAGSLNCAVHARSKTALEIATEIARAASAALPERIEDFAPALRAALLPAGEEDGAAHGVPARQRRRRFIVIIDGLDEAASLAEARAIVRHVVLGIADVAGTRVIVGSRYAYGDGDLLDAFGGALAQIDLDSPEFFEESDLTAYAEATLRLGGHRRPGNPYADQAVADLVAARIAAKSRGNFLVAGLIAGEHGLHDEVPPSPAGLSFSAEVGDVMREYLRRIPEVSAGVSAEEALTALAFAEAPGLPASLWRVALRALGIGDIPEEVLVRFALSPVAGLLIETFGEDDQSATFCLSHQALSDALLHARAWVADRVADERALTRAFLVAGQQAGWADADYLLRSLPAHTLRAGMTDDLLVDSAYLIHADLRRVLSTLDDVSSAAGHARARLLRLTPSAALAGPGERAAQFSVTEALEGLGNAYRAGRWPDAPYRARWAVRDSQSELATLVELRGGRTLVAAASVKNVNDRVQLRDLRTGDKFRDLEGRRVWGGPVSAVPLNGDRTLVAVGGSDGSIWLWDPETGGLARVLDDGYGAVGAVCAVELAEGRTLVTAGFANGAVRLWDPDSGELARTLYGPGDWVYGICAVPLAGGRTLVASSSHRRVCLSDPETGKQVRDLSGYTGEIEAVCPVALAGKRTLLAVSGSYGMWLWDLKSDEPVRALCGHEGRVSAVCPVVLANGHTLLASGGADCTVRLWEPETGTCLLVVPVHLPVNSIAWGDDSLCIGLTSGLLIIDLGDLGLSAR
jgi:hypothetical protein